MYQEQSRRRIIEIKKLGVTYVTKLSSSKYEFMTQKKLKSINQFAESHGKCTMLHILMRIE